MGVVLVHRSAGDEPRSDPVELAVRELPGELSVRACWYDVRSDGRRVGVLAACTDYPERGVASVVTIVVGEPERGRALGTRALLVAERRLLADGAESVWTRVPRDNGRGLYFMLRAGFSPIEGGAGVDGATWFARAGN
jgi:hypothetical protein